MRFFSDSELDIIIEMLFGTVYKPKEYMRTVAHWVLNYAFDRDLIDNTFSVTPEEMILRCMYDIEQNIADRTADEFIVGCLCGLRSTKHAMSASEKTINIIQPDVYSPKIEINVEAQSEPLTIPMDDKKQKHVDMRHLMIKCMLFGKEFQTSPIEDYIVDYVYKNLWYVDPDPEERTGKTAPEVFLSIWRSYIQTALEDSVYEPRLLSLLTDIESLDLVTRDSGRKFISFIKFDEELRYRFKVVTSLSDIDWKLDIERGICRYNTIQKV